uniref:Cytochrome P450 n=1 Tax=Daucus carota subsp. sativus TaxID=79200 RepID=A0A166HAP6_DAUCS
MEIYSTIIALVFFIFLIKLLKKSKTSKTSTKNLPPGPLKLPFVGNLPQVAAAGKVPHLGLQALAKKHGPVMQLQLGEIPLVVISSAKAAEQALRTNDLALADRPSLLLGEIGLANCRDIVFALYGDYWRQMRKICKSELLSVKKVRSFRAIREDESQHLLENIKNSVGSPFNFSESVAGMAHGVISRATTGKRSDDELVRIVEEISYWGAGFLVPDLFPSIKFLPTLTGMKKEIQKLRNAVDPIFDSIIEEHREKLARKKERKAMDNDADEEDLIDVLLRVNENERLEFPMTSNDIQGIVLDMFTAGIDTTSAVIEWAMTELMRNPRVMNKVQAEVRQVLRGKETINEDDIQGLPYLKLVIKEALRLHTPLPLLLPRQCRKECEIDGYHIPVNTKVIINAWAIGRDPEYWADAESFKPERFENNSVDFIGLDYDYLPFGSGRRMCPGMNFGIAGVELPLIQLLYHFDWKLPNNMKPEDLDVEDAFGSTTKRKNQLVLIPTSEYAAQKA